MCPTDPDAYFDSPDLFTPKYDEVHISVTFTWAIKRALWLKKEWKRVCKNIKVGGVAINGEPIGGFKAGIYLKKGVTITSRGCPNRCPFCLINQNLIEFDDFPEGNIVQDNNILACSRNHIKKVFTMLKTQKQICFKGGLEAHRITPQLAEELRSLKIAELWLACDYPNAIKPLKKAVNILQKTGFTQSHLHCFVLIGKDIQEEEERLREVYKIGCMPFAQLYRDLKNEIKYSKEWKQFQRRWTRPAIIRSRCKIGARPGQDEHGLRF